jgi:hypothetical protein
MSIYRVIDKPQRLKYAKFFMLAAFGQLRLSAAFANMLDALRWIPKNTTSFAFNGLKPLAKLKVFSFTELLINCVTE